MFGMADTHVKVRGLLLNNTLKLCLLAAILALIKSLLVLFRWIMDGGVFAKDKVRAPELINEHSSLLLRAEVSFLEISTVNLLL